MFFAIAFSRVLGWIRTGLAEAGPIATCSDLGVAEYFGADGSGDYTKIELNEPSYADDAAFLRYASLRPTVLLGTCTTNYAAFMVNRDGVFGYKIVKNCIKF